jgi:hypothetical protein
VIHIAAAIYSRVKGEGVWTSMVPLLKEKKASTNPIIMKISNLENRLYDGVADFFYTKRK